MSKPTVVWSYAPTKKSRWTIPLYTQFKYRERLRVVKDSDGYYYPENRVGFLWCKHKDLGYPFVFIMYTVCFRNLKDAIEYAKFHAARSLKSEELDNA